MNTAPMANGLCGATQYRSRCTVRRRNGGCVSKWRVLRGGGSGAVVSTAPYMWKPMWCSSIGSRITRACTARVCNGAYERTDMWFFHRFRSKPIPFSVVSVRVSTRRVPSCRASTLSRHTQLVLLCDATLRFAAFLCITVLE